MRFFTSSEFKERYPEYDINDTKIIEASEMIFAQVSPSMRSEWTSENVPTGIKEASMEQARFLIEQDIPHVDTNKLKAGEMSAEIKSEYSTLALTMLANRGFLYRGSPMNYNMGLNISWES